MAIGDRLRLAREQIGLTGAQVSERTGIGASSLSEWEHDKREPKLSQLQALARLYRRSVAFFLEDVPAPRPAVLWRMMLPDEQRGELEARFLQLCEQYHNLEVWCDEKAPVALPTDRGNAATYGYRDAEELAKNVRHELRLGERPATGLLRVLEEACGVKVFHLTFSPAGSAAATVGEAFGPAVLLNAASAPWRRASDLAHELFHVLTWEIFRTGADSTVVCSESANEEKLAGCFARNLLLPDEAMETALRRHSKGGCIEYSGLVDVAREFEVSVHALLWKLHFLWRRAKADEEKTKQDIVKAKAIEALLEPRERPPEPPVWPQRYKALAVKALRRGEMSMGRFAEYLGISRQEAMRYVEQEIADDEAIQVDPA